MLPTSTRELVPFTPAHYAGADGAPVYHLAPLSFLARAAWRRAYAAAGARFVSTGELLEALKRAVPVMLEGGAVESALERIDAHARVTARLAEIAAAARTRETAPAGTEPAPGADADAGADLETRQREALAELGETPEDVEQLARTVAELHDLARREVPPFAALVADHDYWWEVAPPLCVAWSLKRTEGVPPERDAARALVGGVLPVDWLDRLPTRDLLTLGYRAVALTNLAEHERGN